MDSDNKVMNAWARVGTGWRRTMGGKKEDIGNTLHNENFKNILV